MEKVTVRVPATTANLAAGFDVLGCALSLYNKLSFAPAEKLSFSGCPEEFWNEDNLAYVAFAAVWKQLGKAVPPVHIHIEADVPVCRGLGSSAALLVAMPASFFIALSRPMAILERRLHMVGTVICAKLVGCSLPILAEKVGFDPALMASPLITTLVDATSLTIFFLIAMSILPV